MWLLAVLATACVWVGNYGYYLAHKLPDIVFLNHYYAFTPSPGRPMDLYYVTHRASRRQLVTVQISEQVHWYVRGTSTYGDYGPYRLHKASLELIPQEGQLPTEALGTFREFRVWYSDGPSETVPIGEITFTPAEDLQGLPLETVQASSSSTGEHHHTLAAKQDVRLQSVAFSLHSRIADAFDMSVHRTMHEEVTVPFELKTGETVTIDGWFRFEPNDPRRMEAYMPEMRLGLEPAEGSASSGIRYWTQTFYKAPEPDKQGIRRLIEDRKGAERLGE